MRPEIRYNYTMPEVVASPIAEGFAARKERRASETPQDQFDNLVTRVDWLTRRVVGLYPETHPVSKFANGLLSKLNGKDPQPYQVFIYKGQPNAFAIPNGSIFLSDQLLDVAETEEELLFVLAHERIHVKEDHAHKRIYSQQAENYTPRGLVEAVFKQLGRSRFHEWESDARAFDAMDNASINPVGGIHMLEKFREISKGKSGAVHGKDVDRVLNLRSITYLRDMEAIDKPLTDIPAEVKDAVKKEQRDNAFASLYNKVLRDLNERKFPDMVTLRKVDYDMAVLLLPHFISDNLQTGEIKIDSARLWVQQETQIIAYLANKVWEGLNDRLNQAGQFTKQQKAFLFHALLDLGGQEGVTNPEVQKILFNDRFQASDQPGKPQLPWNERNFGFLGRLRAEEDIEELLDCLKPDKFAQLGIKINEDPNAFIDNITESVFKEWMYLDDENALQINEFVNFATSLTTTLGKLYKAHGTPAFKPEKAFTRIISRAKSELTPENVKLLFDNAVMSYPSARSELRRAFQELSSDYLKTTEIPLEEQFIELFRDYGSKLEAIDLEIKRKEEQFSRYGGSFLGITEGHKAREEMLKAFKPRIEPLLKELEADPQSLIRFLGSIKQTIQADSVLREYEMKYPEEWRHLFVGSLDQEKMFSQTTDHQLRFLQKVQFNLMLFDYRDGATAINEALGTFMQSESFDIDTFLHFYKLLKGPTALAEELGFTFSLEDFISKDIADTLIQEGVYVLLHGQLESNISRDRFSEVLEKLTTEAPLDHFGSNQSSHIKPSGHIVTIKDSVLDEIFKKFEFDLSNGNHLKDLYYLSTYMTDQGLATRMQNLVWERLPGHLTFEDGLAFLTKEIHAKRLFSIGALQSFIEKKAQTHEQIEEARHTFLVLLSETTGTVDYGKIVGTEFLIDTFFGQQRGEFLKACIGNGKNDRDLKIYLYDRWKKAFGQDEGEALNMDLDTLMARLYRLDGQSKYVLIRDLLTGDGGVLINKDLRARTELVDYFLETYVEAGDDSEKQYLEEIRKVMHTLVNTARYDLLYFALAPLLQDRILRQPAETVDWQKIIKEEGIPEEFSGVSARYSQFKRGQGTGWRLIRVLSGGVSSESQYKTRDQRIAYESHIENLLGEVEGKPERLKMNVNEFLLEVAQTLGAPGVRFLQILGQYIELPPHLQEAFRNVYDRVEGQSKVSAQYTLKREWPGVETQLPFIGDRVGGGSLMSVFRAQKVDSANVVVKVMNPNALFHTQTTQQLLERVFEDLSSKDKRFEPALPMLTDIGEWIKNDVNFEGFLEEDKQFAKKHDGYSVRGNWYKIRVPQSHPPENKRFMVEEYVEGRNLTQLDQLQREGHYGKDIMTLLTRSFFEQIKDGRVLSDIHPGNIRVSKDYGVYFLDRNYYLNLSFQDKFFLWRLQSVFKDPSNAAKECLNYLKGQGSNVEEEKYRRILDQSAQIPGENDLAGRLMDLTVLLRKEGLRFPLRMTLLVKNLYYLDRLSKQVGFKDISEAYQGKR